MKKKIMILIMFGVVLITFSISNAEPEKGIFKEKIIERLERHKVEETNLIDYLDKTNSIMIEAGLRGRVKLFLLSEDMINNFKDQLRYLRASIKNYKDALAIYDQSKPEMFPWLIIKGNRKLEKVILLRNHLRREMFPAFKKEMEK